MQNIARNYGQSVLLVSATVYGILVHELLESLNRAYLNCHTSTSLRGNCTKRQQHAVHFALDQATGNSFPCTWFLSA